MNDTNYLIRYLPLAKQDLVEAKKYLIGFYPNTWNKALSEIRNKISLLKENPKMYETFTEDPFYRRIVTGKYLVFYHINENQKTIDIHRILRSTWDVRQFMNEQNQI